MATMGGNAPVQQSPQTPPPPSGAGAMEPTKPVPTASPVGIMDWQTRLAAGDKTAATRSVTDNELVKNQLNDLTNSDSKYITQARDRANATSSSRGMLLSNMAGGAAERAVVDAALPIAQQDAATYGSVATANTAAENADRLADQQMHGSLTGQEVGIRANLDEAERGRGYTSNENVLARNWQTGQNATQRTHEQTMQQMDQTFKAGQEALNRDFQGTQNELNFANQRYNAWYEMVKGQQGMLSEQLSAIYSNPNLKANEQAAAAANVRSAMASLFQSFAQTMSAGVPEIFANPYPQGG